MSFVIAAKRSAVVPRGGAFSRLSLEELGAPVVQAVLAACGVGPEEVDEVIVANALGAGGNPARRVALAAGLPERVAGLSIDRQCAGGLDAVLLARALVDSGACRIVVAGGVESHSRRPLRLRTDPDGGEPVAYDQAPFTPWPDRDPGMAQAAEALARQFAITRVEQDHWAVQSHARALQADFGEEIVVIAGQRRDAFERALSLRVAARAKVITGTITGSITAANAAVAADGAAFVVVSAAPRGRALRVVAGATVGADPQQPGLSPLPAIAASGGVRGLAVAEVMEAYAVQAIACVRGAGIDPGIVNLGGGALARGHPIGASGAVLAVRLYHQLHSGRGLATIASAGGVGSALVLQA